MEIIIDAWTNGGVLDPEDVCPVAEPWCLLPNGHDGFCDDLQESTQQAKED